MAETPVDTNASETAGREPKPGNVPENQPKGSPVRKVLVGLVILCAIGAGAYYFIHSHLFEKTDNAFIEGHVVPISSRVPGHVLKVLVEDNQNVQKGDALVSIDSRDYEVTLAQKQAALDAALARQKGGLASVAVTTTTAGAGVSVASSDVASAISAVAAARAAVGAAQAQATKTAADLRRARELFRQKVISQEELDSAVAGAQAASDTLAQAQSQVKVAQSRVEEARGRLKSAGSAPEQVAVSEAQALALAADVAKARAELRQAELQVSYTTITAPQPGRVTRKTVEAGAYVQVGQPLLAIVSPEVWVVANFKETQLTRLRPGQPVDIEVDMYPEAEFHGRVDSIQRGTGSRFSLLPPENATGNFVKVVQRIPVKITFEGKMDSNYQLAPGMSVEPKVRVRE